MAWRPENGVDLLAAGWDYRVVRMRVEPEVSQDASLVGAARDGDRAAFGRLYDLYARMVHGILMAKVPLGAVDDLVQDVFLIALRRLATLRDTARFGAWLAAIARNRAKDYHRRSPWEKRPAEHMLVAESEPSSASADPDGLLILDSIRSLPEAYRETLILRLVEGMTGPEIAAHMGLTHGSVRVNLHRGLQQLRAKLRSNPISASEQET